MNVKNCLGCKKLFNYITGPQLCLACKEKEEQLFQEIKKYVRENPGTTVSAVCKEYGLKRSQVEQWIREDRLQFAPGTVLGGIGCLNCGAPIESGKYCQACKTALGKDLQAQLPKKEQISITFTGNKTATTNRMRFINNSK